MWDYHLNKSNWSSHMEFLFRNITSSIMFYLKNECNVENALAPSQWSAVYVTCTEILQRELYDNVLSHLLFVEVIDAFRKLIQLDSS